MALLPPPPPPPPPQSKSSGSDDEHFKQQVIAALNTFLGMRLDWDCDWVLHNKDSIVALELSCTTQDAHYLATISSKNHSGLLTINQSGSYTTAVLEYDWKRNKIFKKKEHKLHD